MGGTEGHAICSLTLSALLEDVSNQLNTLKGVDLTANENGGVIDGAEEGEENSDEDEIAMDDRWDKCKYSKYECIKEQLDAALERISFSLLETTSLGSFHTELRKMTRLR